MKLQIHERLLILDVVPKQGTIVNVRLINDFVKKVGLSAKEMEDWSVKRIEETGQVKWNDKINTEKEFKVEEAERLIVIDSLEKLGKKEEFKLNQEELYDKFLGKETK